MSIGVLDPESGIFYGVCWVVVIVRLISRRLHRGSWKLLQADDYLILVAMVRDPQRWIATHADRFRPQILCSLLSCMRLQRLAAT